MGTGEEVERGLLVLVNMIGSSLEGLEMLAMNLLALLEYEKYAFSIFIPTVILVNLKNV